MPDSSPRRNPGFRLVRLGLCLLPLLFACERPTTDELLIQGFVYHVVNPDYTTAFYQIYLAYDFDGLPQVPVVKVNDAPIEMTDFTLQQGQYESYNPFPLDTTFDMRIQHYWGEAHSRVNMPGNTWLTEPGPGFVQGLNDPVTITWRKAHGASSYWVDLYVSYEYNDTLGEWDYREQELDTIFSDTTITFPGFWMFPPEVREVLAGEGEIILWPTDGPQLMPGDMGNIKGHGQGYFAAVNEPPEGWFPIVTPLAQRRNTNELIQHSREKFLRRMQRAAGIPESVPLPLIPAP
jgi:hypothetical protein